MYNLTPLDRPYDSLWRPYSETNSRGKTTTTTYANHTTQPFTIVDASGATIATYGYDGARRVTSVANAGAKYTYFNYDGLNHVTQEWGDVPQPVQYSYDSYGARSGMETFQGAATYSVSGGSWSSGGTTGTTTWNFDSYTGLLSGKTDNSGYGPSYTYDGLGRVATRTWHRGAESTYSYDPDSGQLTGVSYSDDGGVTTGLSYSYNRSGQLTGVTDAAGSRTFAYDESIDSGNPLELESEHLDSTFYGGRWLSRLYDNATAVGGSDYGTTLPGFVLGRPIGFQLGDSENSKDDLYQNYARSEYGVFLGVHSQTQNDTARDLIYTRLSSSELVSGYYDYGHSFAVSRSYDSNLDLLTQIQGNYSSTVCTQYNLAYNSLRQVQSVTQTGTAFTDYDGSTGSTYRLLSYDAHGQVTGDVGYLGTIGGSSTPLPDRDYGYAYDAQGNRTASNYSSDSSFQESYTIDALNQITGKTNLSVPVSGTVLNGGPGVVLSNSTTSGGSPVSLVDATVVGGFWAGEATPPTDGSGNPSNSESPSTFYVTATGGWNGSHFSPNESSPVNSQTRAVTMPAKSQTLSYDSDGNLTNDGIWAYTYDAENRIVKMVADSGTALTNTQLNFTYDYMGRRVEKIVTVSSSTTYDHRFVYDGWNLIGDYKETGSLSLYRTFTWGLDVSGSLSATGGVGALIEITNCVSGTPSDYFPTYDGNGNVASLIRASDGNVSAAYEYSAFGQSLRAETNDTTDSTVDDNPFRFSSKFTDTETGLVYYGNRFYSPTLGRFVNKDSAEESGGINLYAFCGNDGINGVDILGFQQAGDPNNPTSEAYALNRSADEQGTQELVYGLGVGSALAGIASGAIQTSAADSDFAGEAGATGTQQMVNEANAVAAENPNATGHPVSEGDPNEISTESVNGIVRGVFVSSGDFVVGGITLDVASGNWMDINSGEVVSSENGDAVAPNNAGSSTGGGFPTVTSEAFIKDKYIMWVGPFAGDNHGFTDSPAGIANSRYTLTAQNGQVFGLQNQTHLWGGILGWAGNPIYGGTETETSPGVYAVNMNIIARDPYGFGLAPAVSNSVYLTIDTNTGTVDGTVRYSSYPSLQVFVNGTPVFQHDQSIILGSLTMGTGQVHVTLPSPSTPGP